MRAYLSALAQAVGHVKKTSFGIWLKMLSQTQVQLCFVIVSIQAAWGNLINPCQDDNSPLTNNCFFCICEQASNCDVYKECSGGGFPGGPWCGPLNIGMDFWIQYGNCTLDGDDPKDPLCKC